MGWTVDQDALADGARRARLRQRRLGRLLPCRPAEHRRRRRPTPRPGRATATTSPSPWPVRGPTRSASYGINTAGGTINTELGCRTVVSPAQTWAPYGSLDSATVAGRTVTLSGWTLDGDAPTQSLPVHVYVDGRYTAATVADRSRTDVARAYPGTGTTHGYTAALDVAAGRHQSASTRIDAGPGHAQPAPGLRHGDRRGRRLESVRQPRLGHRGERHDLVRGWVVDPDAWTTAGARAPLRRRPLRRLGRRQPARADVARVVPAGRVRRTATPATCAWPAAPTRCARTRSTRRRGRPTRRSAAGTSQSPDPGSAASARS